jgi:hypothetical protein
MGSLIDHLVTGAPTVLLTAEPSVQTVRTVAH